MGLDKWKIKINYSDEDWFKKGGRYESLNLKTVRRQVKIARQAQENSKVNAKYRVKK